MPYAFTSPVCFSMIARRPSMTFNRLFVSLDSVKLSEQFGMAR